MEGQLAEAVKKERAAELAAVEARLERAYRQHFVGQKEQVLFEESISYQGQEWQIGHTTRYVKVAVPAARSLEGQIRQVNVLSFTEEDFLRGELLVPEEEGSLPQLGLSSSC